MPSSKPEAKFKLWLELDGKTVMSQGRADLLMEIRRLGSLSAAARRLGISYHKAHDMVSELNERLGEEVLVTSIGGPEGGGTEITPAGKKLVNEYLDLKSKLENISDKYFD